MKSPSNSLKLVSVIYGQKLLAASAASSSNDSEATESLRGAVVKAEKTELVTESVDDSEDEAYWQDVLEEGGQWVRKRNAKGGKGIGSTKGTKAPKATKAPKTTKAPKKMKGTAVVVPSAATNVATNVATNDAKTSITAEVSGVTEPTNVATNIAMTSITAEVPGVTEPTKETDIGALTSTGCGVYD